MGHFATLWLPTIVSAVLVFVVSAILHMVTNWHRSDYGKLPDEDAFVNAVRPLAIPPGDYTIPVAASQAEMRTPEFARKLEEGPRIMMIVQPNGMPEMGRLLVSQFIYGLLVSWFAGHVALVALGSGASNLNIIHTVGVVAFAAYGLAVWPLWIWYGRSLVTTLKENVDALIYAAITAATFAWLWPK